MLVHNQSGGIILADYSGKGNCQVEIALIHVWLDTHLSELLASGRNWKICLNGTAGGSVHYEVLQTGEVVSSKKQRGTLKEFNE